MMEDLFGLPEDEAAASLRARGFADGKGALKNLKLLSQGPFGGHIELIVQEALNSPSPGGALNNLETIAKELSEDTASRFLKDPLINIRSLITIAGSSQFLSNILSRNPSFFEWLFTGGGLNEVKDTGIFTEELRERTAGIVEFEPMAKALRVYKQKEFLRIGARDLLGLAPMEEVTGELSGLAGASLSAALEFSVEHHKKACGAPSYTDEDGAIKEASFAVIGLGKLGGGELNFSSDIDIIYIYSSDKGETGGIEGRPDSRISLHAFFVKVSMTLTRLVSGVTEDGIVFRIDLDLRPEGKSGDMANSLRSAEIYYESWGQPWERAALIKARCVAGSTGLGSAFLSMIRPFVYRRYLDFTAIEEIKSMKEKIDLSLLRRNPDTVDVKLGAGGIREVEFMCQALQLIHAGKDAEIRERNTLKAVEKLSVKGFLGKTDAESLREGYTFLRNLEHRIQIVEGRQSQAIPARPEELERLARMMGFKDTEAGKAGEHFWEEYKNRTAKIHDIYRSLFYKAAAVEVPDDIVPLFSPDMPEEEAAGRLKRLGFKDTAQAYRNLALLKGGPSFVRVGARARLLLQKLAPVFLYRAASSPDPDRALQNLERFISAVGAKSAFYSLLAENPKVTDELVLLFGTSVFLSRTLIERPESLDLLLSKELSTPYRTRGEFSCLRELRALPDYESRLDALRMLKNQEVFRIGINDVRGALTPRQVSAQITFMAEAALAASVDIAAAELQKLYGSPGQAGFAVLGLGKLGGRELIYGSDLDIVFVYSDEGAVGPTAGPRVISSREFFVKLGQRIISALTLRTKEGFVFNVDARLRPSGSSGPLVVSRGSLIKYHREKTQIWERQAFIKARAVAGDTAFGEEVVAELKEALYARALSGDDADEMLRIRKRMEVEIAKEDSSRYNIKTGKGGIVDIEFLVQALQLKWGSLKRSLRTPYTLKALLRLSREGIIAKEEYAFLKNAYGFYRLLEMRLRIVHDRPEGYLYRDSEELSTLARRAGYTGADAGKKLIGDYAGYAERVRALYLKTMEGLKEERA